MIQIRILKDFLTHREIYHFTRLSSFSSIWYRMFSYNEVLRATWFDNELDPSIDDRQSCTDNAPVLNFKQMLKT